MSTNFSWLLRLSFPYGHVTILSFDWFPPFLSMCALYWRSHSSHACMWILYNTSYTMWSTVTFWGVRLVRFTPVQYTELFQGNLSWTVGSSCAIWILHHNVFVTWWARVWRTEGVRDIQRLKNKNKSAPYRFCCRNSEGSSKGKWVAFTLHFLYVKIVLLTASYSSPKNHQARHPQLHVSRIRDTFL